jgi:hypothetical protein
VADHPFALSHYCVIRAFSDMVPFCSGTNAAWLGKLQDETVIARPDPAGNRYASHGYCPGKP